MFFCLLAINTVGQDLNTFSGFVVDSYNQPIVGANLRTIDGKIGTLSKESGKFNFIHKDSTLIIIVSYLVY